MKGGAMRCVWRGAWRGVYGMVVGCVWKKRKRKEVIINIIIKA